MKNGKEKENTIMIKVVADNYIKAEKVDEFISLAEQLVKMTKENDTGCIQYELLQDVKNLQHLTMLEQWEDQKALTRHMESKHFKDAAVQFKDYMEKPSEVDLFHILA